MLHMEELLLPLAFLPCMRATLAGFSQHVMLNSLFCNFPLFLHIPAVPLLSLWLLLLCWHPPAGVYPQEAFGKLHAQGGVVSQHHQRSRSKLLCSSVQIRHETGFQVKPAAGRQGMTDTQLLRSWAVAIRSAQCAGGIAAVVGLVSRPQQQCAGSTG
jgi:hypothetical protein